MNCASGALNHTGTTIIPDHPQAAERGVVPDSSTSVAISFPEDRELDRELEMKSTRKAVRQGESFFYFGTNRNHPSD